MIVLKKQLLAARRPHEKIESEYDPPTNRTDPFGKEMRDTKIKIRKQKTCGYVANDLSCLGSQYISFMASGCRKSGGMCSIPDLSSDSFFAYECTMFCPRRVAMRQVTFECNCGSNLTD